MVERRAKGEERVESAALCAAVCPEGAGFEIVPPASAVHYPSLSEPADEPAARPPALSGEARSALKKAKAFFNELAEHPEEAKSFFNQV